METTINLAGMWQVNLDGASPETYEARVPGTLDGNGIGGPDRPEKQWGDGKTVMDEKGIPRITTRFTRKHTFTGPAVWTRKLVLQEKPGKERMILTVERSRKLSLTVNGQAAKLIHPGSLSTPWMFEACAMRKGENELRLVSDNSYPGWPGEAILYSSAATDETQTNWNGLLGKITLEARPGACLLAHRLIADPQGDRAEIQADLSVQPALEGETALLTVRCEALAAGEASLEIRLGAGLQTVRMRGAQLRQDLRRWDPDDPWRYPMETELLLPKQGIKDVFRKKIGIRDFRKDGRDRLSLNGRRILIRSEANCAAYPETGHPPMETESWRRILQQYQAYGVNCVRFHSHCPPEAAFEAADEAGMMMQPELSHWDPRHAFESEESYAYYRTELREILRMLACHPSFVMLTLGNELWCDETGRGRMAELVREARHLLPDRLYAWGSNAFYGTRGCDEESDFYTAQNLGPYQMRAISAGADGEHPTEKVRIRGYLNNVYPNARTNYNEGMAALRKEHDQPIFSFEVGQYEVLPDFHELADFHGVTEPENYRIIRERAEKRGMMPLWDRMVEASGELALIGYREETESVMRTPGMSGLSLLSLQDFPGQGTAIVGLMNAHLRPKPFDFARPERFQAFYRDRLPIPELEKYTYWAGETLRAGIRAVNYGRESLTGILVMTLLDEAGHELARTSIQDFAAPAGEAELAGNVELRLPRVSEPVAAEWRIALQGQESLFANRGRIWIYPKETVSLPENVLRARIPDCRALAWLEQGGTVLLEPDGEAMPGSIRGQFTTDFWSVGTFPQQEGGMGLLIQEDHPLFRHFPTSFHTDYQWWLMAGQRALRLPDESLAEGILVRQMDSYAQLRSFAMMLEARVGRGRVLVCTMELDSLPDKPEVRQLKNAIARYLGSEAFQPRLSIPEETLAGLFRQEMRAGEGRGQADGR